MTILPDRPRPVPGMRGEGRTPTPLTFLRRGLPQQHARPGPTQPPLAPPPRPLPRRGRPANRAGARQKAPPPLRLRARALFLPTARGNGGAGRNYLGLPCVELPSLLGPGLTVTQRRVRRAYGLRLRTAVALSSGGFAGAVSRHLETHLPGPQK